MWKTVEGFSDYAVNIKGDVLSLKTQKILASRNNARYDQVGLYSDSGRRVNKRVHKLVAEAFLGPCPKGMEVRHLDGNSKNNHLHNLCYSTHIENEQDKETHGTRSRGEHRWCSKLTEKDVLQILKDDRSQKAIADDYGVSPSTIGQVKRRKRWRHVGG